MYIHKLQIENFKCYKYTEITFEPNFNLIIGGNNTGKSTVFEAFRLWQLAINNFYTKRTGKKGNGDSNIGFFKNNSFKDLNINDLSFLRIDDLNNIFNTTNKRKKAEDTGENYNHFKITIIFNNKEGDEAIIPVIFRSSSKNTLRCKIDLNTIEDDIEGRNKLIKISHSLSKVMDLANNSSFINRIRLAYIPPKFTIPHKEFLYSENNALILDKLLKGESQEIIRNILHYWAPFSYQKSTRNISPDKINKLKVELNKIISTEDFDSNFINVVKPYIEDVRGANIIEKRKSKSKNLLEIENGLNKIIGEEFDLYSDKDPVNNYCIQIKNKKDNTEISQLGSGTLNILNILTVLNFNEQSIDKASTKCNILLLDEPDSHIHSNLQKNLFNYLEKLSKEENRQIFIITHNSSLISQFDKVLFLEKNEKYQSTISLSEYLEEHLKSIDEALYSVIKELNDTKSEKNKLEESIKQIKDIEVPLVYTEGPTDIIILENAYRKIYSEDANFKFINGHSCKQLKNTFETNDISAKNPQIPLICIFDFDEAYNDWNGLWKKSSDITIDSPYKGLTKKHKDKNLFAMLLPIPEVGEIKSQVIKKDNETFGGNSKMSIEHLFYGDPKFSENFETESSPGGGQLILFKGDKMKFAKRTELLDVEDFKNFIPLFDNIRNIIKNT